MTDDAARQVRLDLLAIAQLRYQRATIRLRRATAASLEIEQAIASHRSVLADLGERKSDAEHDYERRLLWGGDVTPALAAFVVAAGERQQREKEAIERAQGRWCESQEAVRQAAWFLLAQEERISMHQRALYELDEAGKDARDEDGD